MTHRTQWVVIAAALAGCVRAHVTECSDGRICPATSACDEVHHGCVMPDQLMSCIGLADGDACVIGGSGDGLCRDQVCLGASCGDGFRRGDELCDGAELGSRPDCTDHGYYDSKPIGCNTACGYDTSACTGFCGDGTVNGPELCDGAPPAQSCLDYGFDAGFLDCSLCGPGFDECAAIGLRVVHYAGASLHGIDGTADDNIYAVGGNSTVLHHTDVWTKRDLSSCLPSSTQVSFTAVSALGTEAIAVGTIAAQNAVAVHLTATGCTLTTLPATDVFGVWAATASDVYATSSAGILHWNGASWSISSSVGVLDSIWGSAGNDVYAASYGGLLHYNGSAWASVASELPLTTAGAYAVIGTSSTDVYAAVIEQATDKVVIVHRDASGWTNVTPTSLGLSTGLALAGGRLFSRDLTEVRAHRGAGAASLGSVLALEAFWGAPSGKLYMVSADNRITMFPGAVMHDQTVYGGDGRTITAAGQATAALFVGGKTIMFDRFYWYQDTYVPDATANWMDPATGDLYVLFGGSLFRRPAGMVSFDNYPASPETTITGASNIYGRAATDLWFTDTARTALRHYDGSQVTCTSCTAPSPVWTMWGRADDDHYAVGAGGMVLHWNGATWSAMTSGTSASLYGVAGSSATDVWAVGDAGTVLHFDGASWTSIDVGTDLPLSSVWAFAPDDVFVGGVAGTLRHFDGTRWTPVRNPSTVAIVAMFGVDDTLYMLDEYAKPIRLVRTRAW